MIEKKVYVQNLEKGMYVSRLDRPWTQTDFLFQGGFTLSSDKEIARLQKTCDYVFVDVDACSFTAGHLDKLLLLTEGKSPPEQEIKTVTVTNSVPVEKELNSAFECYRVLSGELGRIMTSIQVGKNPDVTELAKQVSCLIDSVTRNTDASLLLTHLKSKGGYNQCHAISTAIFATTFGRRLGFKRQQLKELALGSMLCNLGMLKIPDALLNKQGKLAELEVAALHKHAEFSAMLLTRGRGANDRVIGVAMYHHERYDGKGYPVGLSGDLIPLFARIAGIVDSYDAMISNRAFRKAHSHEDIISALYKEKGMAFPADLLEYFIEFIGMYPTGTLVEMSTGEVAVVLSQGVRKMQPRVMVILDQDKKRYKTFKSVDLSRDAGKREGERKRITKALELDAFGVDPPELYLSKRQLACIC